MLWLRYKYTPGVWEISGFLPRWRELYNDLGSNKHQWPLNISTYSYDAMIKLFAKHKEHWSNAYKLHRT